MTTTLERPADSAGELYYPTPVTPEEAFQAIGRLRKEARDEIDRLIRFLDETDNHMEREEAVDDVACDDHELEPSLGSFDGMTDQSKSWKRVQGEFGAEDDAEKDDCDCEPSLGSREHSNQEAWGYQPAEMRSAAGTDLEDEHDGAEPPEDGEPSLGWTTSGVMGGLNDRELDNCDRESNEPLLTECA